jgi:predicted nucleic acid-binding protein
VKLPLREREHVALRRELTRWEGPVSSALLRTEAVRACARYGERYVARAAIAIERVALVPLDEPVIDSAARLDPPELRTLDALHLATALSLGPDLGVLFAYDDRLLGAARAAGIRAESPA